MFGPLAKSGRQQLGLMNRVAWNVGFALREAGLALERAGASVQGANARDDDCPRHRRAMSVYGAHPRTHRAAFVAPSASVLGSVTLSESSSVWYGAVVSSAVPAHERGRGTSGGDPDEPGAPLRASASASSASSAVLIRKGAQVRENAVVSAGSARTDLSAVLASLPEPIWNSTNNSTNNNNNSNKNKEDDDGGDGVASAGSLAGVACLVGPGAVVGPSARVAGAFVGARAVVGAGAVILEGAVLGPGSSILPNSVVAPGSVVPPGERWGGAPAAKVGTVVVEEEKGGESAGVVEARAHAAEAEKTWDEVRADVARRMREASRDPDFDAHLGLAQRIAREKETPSRYQ